ncbi:MAG: hypothetical protein NTZ34_08480 [Chloroflexi bacterium]|nr:hypothetical protein [Chloroflexota bacterium]
MNSKFFKTAIILVLGSFLAVSVVFVLILFAVKGVSCQPAINKTADCSQEQAAALSLSLIKNSPTFTFDGIKDSIQQVKAESPDKGSTWNLIYSFKTAHSGHGDRSGEMLAQVVTGHTAQITVTKCKITSAVCDKTWNLLTNTEK